MLNHVIRYEPVARAVEATAPATLLEVGSGSRGIAPYLSALPEITACDVSFDDYGSTDPGTGGGSRRVEGSVLDLPFGAGSFDAVVALDLLEHLGPGDRPRALRELARVAQGTLIVGCPCGAAALASDRQLEGFYHALARPVPIWLAEHLAHGFPEERELIEALTPFGRLDVVPNATVRAHRLILSAEALPGAWRAPFALGALLRRGLLDSRTRAWSRRAARALRGRDLRPTYRTIVVLHKAL